MVPGVQGHDSPRELTEQQIESLSHRYDSLNTKRKGKAQAALSAVQGFHSAVAAGASRNAALEVLTATCGTSVSTLEKWLGKVRGQPEHAWLFLLADNYAGRTAKAETSAEAWEFLKALYLAPERRTAKSCIVRLRRAAAEHNWTVPSTRTLERRLKFEIPEQVRVMARHGKKAAQELYPAQVRSRIGLASMDIIDGDGYLHNLWIQFPDGEVRRAKTWFWQDIYSSKIIGWRTDKTEHTDVIRLSFGDVVEQYGIPNKVSLDNTLAAANKTMSGGVKHRFRFKIKPEEPLGVFALVIGPDPIIWATPGHGQAKPIERLFGVGGMGEYIDKAPDLAGAWTGASPLDKPEYDGKSRAVPLHQVEAVIAREVAAFNAMDGRRSPIHQGRSFDSVFNESFAQAKIRRATEAQRRLWLLATEPVRANSKDGAITLETGRITRSDVAPTYSNRYWAPDLIDYAGRQVVARFDPKRLHEGVHIYSLDGRYICFANCFSAKGFADQDAAREHQRARSSFNRATKQGLEAIRRMDALQASKFLPGVERTKATDLTIPAPKVVRGEFRDPLERPPVVTRALNEAEQVFMKQAEEELRAPAVNVHELSESGRHKYWQALDARRAEGEALADADDAFWRTWQTSGYYKAQTEADAEFEERMAARG